MGEKVKISNDEALLKRIGITIVRDYTMVFVLLALLIVMPLISDVFLTMGNIMNLFRQVAVIGIVSVGVHIVIIGGTFDQSVGSTCTLVGCVCLMIQPYVGVIPSILISIALGALIGLINGTIVTLIKANSGDSFMVTFGMLSLIQAIALVVTGGYPINGSKSEFFNMFGKGTIGDVFPVSFLVFIILTILSAVLMQKTTFGKRIYYMGCNPKAARLSGINVNKQRILSYVISGACAAMAAIVLTGRINGATSKMGKGYEFDAITAVVVGGISLSGGKGNAINMFIGVCIMGIIANGLNVVGVQTESQYVVRGLVLIIAVLVDVLRSRKIN